MCDFDIKQFSFKVLATYFYSSKSFLSLSHFTQSTSSNGFSLKEMPITAVAKKY